MNPTDISPRKFKGDDSRVRPISASDQLIVLYIEDNHGDSRLIQEMLSESEFVPFSLRREPNLTAGLAWLEKNNPDIILLDLSLPDSQGMETLHTVRRFSPDSAVIVLTGLNDEKLGIQALQSGAQDYLVKGQINSQLLIRTILYAAERKRNEMRLEYLATHDGLTGLPNRQLFQDRLEHALDQNRRERRNGQKGHFVSVMLLDLDDFKGVNDTLGHAQGDLLLRAVADRLVSCLRKSDTAARMGGDEFTLVNEDIRDPQACITLAKKILNNLSKPYKFKEHTIRVTASLGISLYPSDGDNSETLLKYADIAMYRAKQKGNSYRFYSLQ